MIRDTFFSQTRFVNLCRKEMVENWKSNLLRVALMYGAMAVIMLWSGYLSYRAVGQDTDSTWEFNLVIFMWGLCVFGCLSASFTMERMKSKTGRLSVLMTPATSFEKYFSRWLVFTVVFLIVSPCEFHWVSSLQHKTYPLHMRPAPFCLYAKLPMYQIQPISGHVRI